MRAYQSWQGLFRLLQYLSHAAFGLCAYRLASLPATWISCFSPAYLSQLMFGFMLASLSVWSFASCYEVLGEYGWYYGDFFLPPGSCRHDQGPSSVQQGAEDGLKPSYKSIYRYINNPEVYLGHLWMYGLAIVSSSPDLGAVALLSHAMKIAFLQAVETPHLRQVYKQHVREHTPLEDAIEGGVDSIRSSETSMFLVNWVKHPIETGALAPSSRRLARAMCETMYLGDNSVVVELGPGTGPFTKEILRIQGGHTNTTYLAFELSDEFVALLQKNFPAQKDNFIKESAEKIVDELKKRKLDYADTVISGLPWAIFPAELQRGIMDQVKLALRPGGRFCTFAYLQGLVLPAGQRFKNMLQDVFEGDVERSNIVWKNLPPAFVYRCEKKPGP